jgi:hypothetical protein
MRKASFKTVSLDTLEAWLDLLLSRARYGGRKFGAFALLIDNAVRTIAVLESDKSLPVATRKRLIREHDSAIGAAARKAAMLGRGNQILDVIRMVQEDGLAEPNQYNVFSAYRAVVRRDCSDDDAKVVRAPSAAEWLAEDLKERKTKATKKYKNERDLVLREMARRFKLPLSPAP